MKRHALLLLTLTPVFFLAGCGAGKNQSPVAAEDEVGQVKSGLEAQAEKPTTYTAEEGDDLRKIAARPEIYGDPELWPLIQAANADKVGQGRRVNMGTELAIPRDSSDEQLEEAREKSRQTAAASKMRRKRAPEPEVQEKKVTPAKVADAPPVATPVPAKPVPPAKKGGGLWSLLLILLLVLAALAAVLFYYSRKDARENGS